MVEKLVPGGIKKLLANKLDELSVNRRKKEELEIPKVQLQQKNINNLKTVLNRDLMLALFPKNAVVAEIGVDRGGFSEIIDRITKPSKFFLLDLWSNGAPNKFQKEVEEKFAKEVSDGRVEIRVGYSTDLITKFPDGFFDWVYLDTDHSYSLTAKELDLLKNKIKPNGLIAGHDYTIGNWVGGVRYGVIEAVHEFCVRENWEIIYLTIESEMYRSFALRKL